jgi:hypothetical protein
MVRMTFDVVDGSVEHIGADHHHVAYICPFCSRKASICLDAGNLTPCFSLSCDKDGRVFLVHWGEQVN